MKALVIDDSRAMRLILGKLLSSLGFTILEAANGRLGLDTLRFNDDVDLVVVDWNMPEMDGLAFIRAVRAEDGWNDIRLLLLSAETDLERLQQAVGAGADGHMSKPLTAEGFRAKVRDFGLAVSA